MNQKQKNNIDTEIDFDSFAKSQQDIQKYSAGMVRITKCRLIKNTNELPQGYINHHHNILHDKYLILTGEKAESDVEVVIPISSNENKCDLEFCYKWTDKNSIDFLAGQRIPVYHITDNIFRVQKFDSGAFKYIPLNKIKDLINKDIIHENIDGQWEIKTHYKIFIYTSILISSIILMSMIYVYTSSLIISIVISFVIWEILDTIIN